MGRVGDTESTSKRPWGMRSVVTGSVSTIEKGVNDLAGGRGSPSPVK